MDARITGSRSIDELVQLDLVFPGEGEQQLKSRPTLPRLQPGQCADRDPGGVAQLRQRHAAPLTQRPQPWPDALQDFVDFVVHLAQLAILATMFVNTANRRHCSPTTAQTNRGEPPVKEKYDVVIVGGGAAGLSAGLALSRARRAVLVVDAGTPRNAPAEHVHNFLTRDGMPPAELLAAGRAEVTGYGGEILSGTVSSAAPLEDGFQVTLTDGGVLLARRLLVTTGLVDELPDVRGLTERWGRDVVHCPYCHGWEVRDQEIGILATSPIGVQQALLFRQWSEDVTLFLHTAPDPTDDQWEQLTARGIAVVMGEVSALEVTDDQLNGVRLASGQVIPRQAMAVAPRFTARTDVLTSLGLEPTEEQLDGHVFGTSVAADPSGATAVPGVWVAGNVADLRAQVISAAAAGLNTAAAINADLIAEDTRHAVAARRGALTGSSS
jgi:thioredoxin reductase